MTLKNATVIIGRGSVTAELRQTKLEDWIQLTLTEEEGDTLNLKIEFRTAMELRRGLADTIDVAIR